MLLICGTIKSEIVPGSGGGGMALDGTDAEALDFDKVSSVCNSVL